MQEQSMVSNVGKSDSHLTERATYHVSNRIFVVEPIFKEDSPNTLGSILHRLIVAESEKS